MKKVLGLVLVILLVSLAFSINWKQFDGTTIRILANRHPWTTMIEPLIPEFESLTGIKVVLEVFPEDQFRTKRTVEISSGVADVDLFMIMPGQDAKKYTLENWLYPLSGLIKDPNLTDESWDYSDFFAGVLEGGNFGGIQYAIPIQAETSLLAYRKDIFEAFGIEVPQTMEELENVAKMLTLDFDKDGKADFYGITLRGKGAAATSQFVDFLYTIGGEWMKNGKWALDSKEAINAFEFYGKLLRKYGPPGATNIHWYESTSYFMQGKAAMIYDANVFKGLYEDPEKSKVAGKVGYAMIPAGPNGLRKPHVSQWDLAIYSGSKNPEAAWLFIQWATTKEMSLKGLLEYGIPAARASSWNSSEYKAKDPNPDWTKASMDSFAVGNPVWNPPVINVSEARDIVGTIIITAIQGGNVEKAIKSALSQLRFVE
ncbi:hypothetical protein AT15_05295 [Kosmotoga arenicorallina S304]|uniref:ABC transporter substrate-binding protein n=1 Tax=Kosmotoga arenicorallina S304 TaxID=1453497 RepID=A0A176JUW5_9BACT|nr:sugar ABC transporter substrate-binding protein [Kosmotoga arenicorallina]OAA27236.1 hypothetical protein AT15_05295 [Kosmotoga arenicorallina S304]